MELRVGTSATTDHSKTCQHDREPPTVHIEFHKVEFELTRGAQGRCIRLLQQTGVGWVGVIKRKVRAGQAIESGNVLRA